MKLVERIIGKLIPNYDKLNMLANAIDKSETDESGSLKIVYKNNLTQTTKGSMLTYTKNGVHIHKARYTFINPVLESHEHKDEINMLKDKCIKRREARLYNEQKKLSNNVKGCKDGCTTDQH